MSYTRRVVKTSFFNFITHIQQVHENYVFFKSIFNPTSYFFPTLSRDMYTNDQFDIKKAHSREKQFTTSGSIQTRNGELCANMYMNRQKCGWLRHLSRVPRK